MFLFEVSREGSIVRQAAPWAAPLRSFPPFAAGPRGVALLSPNIASGPGRAHSSGKPALHNRSALGHQEDSEGRRIALPRLAVAAGGITRTTGPARELEPPRRRRGTESAPGGRPGSYAVPSTGGKSSSSSTLSGTRQNSGQAPARVRPVVTRPTWPSVRRVEPSVDPSHRARASSGRHPVSAG
jgi:hypothetical protein